MYVTRYDILDENKHDGLKTREQNSILDMQTVGTLLTELLFLNNILFTHF